VKLASVPEILKAAMSAFNRGSGKEVDFTGPSASVGDVFSLAGLVMDSDHPVTIRRDYMILRDGFKEVAWEGHRWCDVTPALRLWLAAFRIACDPAVALPDQWKALNQALIDTRKHLGQLEMEGMTLLWRQANDIWILHELGAVPSPEKIEGLETALSNSREWAYGSPA
jgi:hypothetical protein